MLDNMEKQCKALEKHLRPQDEIHKLKVAEQLERKIKDSSTGSSTSNSDCDRREKYVSFVLATNRFSI
jgi:hypothetical protein